MGANSFPRLSIRYVPVSQLKPFAHNARTHNNRQIKSIANSIRLFGWINPVIIDRSNRIIAGHGRVEAAKALEIEEVPTIQIENLTEDQIRAYVIGDNKLASNAGWDKEILAIELQHLMTLDGLDFDITVTGFEVPEIDLIIEEANSPPGKEDWIPEIDPEKPAVSQPGDLWQLGKHRIICDNALREGAYRSLMGRTRASVVFSDPPFNVKIDGHATGNGRIRHREFLMASGEMSEAEFLAFLNDSLRLLSRYSVNNSIHYICMDWRHVGDLITAGRQNYDALLNFCIWLKDNGGMGSFYRSRHELVLVFRKGKGPHRNNVQLGRFGRNRSNVWQYPSIHSLSKQGDEGNLLALHPTVKPVAMVADALLDCSARGEVVLDAFLGSGTTLMAAERVGRVCFSIEIDPRYVDVAIRRWQDYTGQKAVHASTGRYFDQIAASGEETNVCE